jgi:Rrf2 family nitric oxide-sensitive transcriptional repressor
MQLTRFTDLGLRLLMYLGSAEADHDPPVTIGEVAARFGVSHHHLVKVAHLLVQTGWVTATRGKGGGLRLALAAGEIRVGAVVRELEGGRSLIDCAQPACTLRGACRLKGALDAAQQAFFAALDAYTLADVVAGTSAAGLARLRFHPPGGQPSAGGRAKAPPATRG